jgi:ubiquinone/menaquinone biosynthesis C-methylase UbiE
MQHMPAPPPGGIVGVFDRVADTYDAVGVEWFGPIAAGLVRALDPRPGESVLDVGCGKGAALLPLAEAVGPDGHVTGIDLAPRMVDAAAAAVRERGFGHVDVRVADAAAPGLPAGAYDVVASSLVLFFLSDPAAALTGWTTLLRPGGRLGVATFGPNDPVWSDVDAVFTPYLPERMRDARTTGRRGPFASDEGMEALLAGAGLVGVRTVTTTVDAVLRDADHWYAFSWSHGQRVMWECVPEGEREAVRRQAYAVLEGARSADGSIHFGQQVRYTLGRRAG